MRPSGNVIEETLLVYALDGEQSAEVERRLDRVARHYVPLLDKCPRLGHVCMGAIGMALWSRRAHASRWPQWSNSENLSVATVGALTGWRRLGALGKAGHDAAQTLGQKVTVDPDAAAELNPPFVLGIANRHTGTILLSTDCAGIGRLYALSFDGGTVWSNRLGALPLFAGMKPREDVRAWQVLAACGWFLGELTPIEGARKIGPATTISISSEGGALERLHQPHPLEALVRPRRTRLRNSARLAAVQAAELVEDLSRSTDEPLRIALTGGRDSRLSAAAALAVGANATFNTGDQVPGEVDAVRQLIAAAPVEMEHSVYEPSVQPEPDDDLLQRARAIHLVHDGLRNPQELRRPTEIPFSQPNGFSLSGHGGELGHGFYYHDKKRIRRLKRGGLPALLAQLERAGRRKHSAATDDAYAIYMEEVEATLREGVECGLTGPNLLDFFYLAQRLPYRSGLGARSGRASVCVTPGFVRASFDLSPSDRIGNRLHDGVIRHLMPAWAKVPYFAPPPDTMPPIKRRRIWERPHEAPIFEELLASPELWSDVFRTEAVRSMWREVRGGEGSADYEHIFDRVIWRAVFRDHLRALGDNL